MAKRGNPQDSKQHAQLTQVQKQDTAQAWEAAQSDPHGGICGVCGAEDGRNVQEARETLGPHLDLLD